MPLTTVDTVVDVVTSSIFDNWLKENSPGMKKENRTLKIMKEKFSRFEVSEYLETEQDILLYLEACQAENDPALVDIARARNMTQLANTVGMSRAGLYKALSAEGNPSFVTVSKVAAALGLKISIHPSSNTN